MAYYWSHVDWIVVGIIAASSLITAFTALVTFSRSGLQDNRGNGGLFAHQTSGTTFLFDGSELVDATSCGRALLADGPEHEDSWRNLLGRLAPRFPTLENHVADLERLGRVTLVSEGPRPLTLRAEWRGGLTRIALFDPRDDGESPIFDPVGERAQQDELAALRLTMDAAPLLIWREAEDGAVIWANRQYLDLAHQDPGEELSWPLPRLFTDLRFADDTVGPAQPVRASLAVAGSGPPLWFECESRVDRSGRIVFALPADSAVQAEDSLRSFIQTLTKTFAHLSIGLAIFDRQRQLALFNPALITLTQLSPEFLSARPSLTDCLDAMREKRTIPEPKDYKAWRAQMAALERAAASGQYEETWSLPSGLTYRVIGRPHPDGAVAFLFEDISAEMSQTRRFRAELELSQAVIDNFDVALAVFSPAGKMLMSNRTYRRLWNQPLEESPVEACFDEAVRLWQAHCAPSPLWDRLRDFIATVSPREPWTSEVRLVDGRALAGSFLPLAGGATLVRFGLAAPRVQDETLNGKSTAGLPSHRLG